MRKTATVLTLCAGLAGCATMDSGNFVQDPSSGTKLDQQAIASSLVHQLVTLYPPAKTPRLVQQHAMSDPFGRALVKGLRTRGYALVAFRRPIHRIQCFSRVGTCGYAVRDPAGLPLRYVLDQTRGTDLYRVMVQVGKQSLTRPFVRQASTTVPAGDWEFKQ